MKEKKKQANKNTFLMKRLWSLGQLRSSSATLSQQICEQGGNSISSTEIKFGKNGMAFKETSFVHSMSTHINLTLLIQLNWPSVILILNLTNLGDVMDLSSSSSDA
jgi:hypothetical protein